MEQLTLIGAPLALDVPEYVPPPGEPRCFDMAPVVPLWLVRQKRRGVKSSVSQSYEESA